MDTNHKIFEKLKKTALEDGVMSVEETMLISYAMKSASAFDNALRRAKQDNIIDEKEKKELDDLRKRIFEDAAIMAERDNIINKDEVNLLTKLLEVIEDLKKEYEE